MAWDLFRDMGLRIADCVVSCSLVPFSGLNVKLRGCKWNLEDARKMGRWKGRGKGEDNFEVLKKERNLFCE